MSIFKYFLSFTVGVQFIGTGPFVCFGLTMFMVSVYNKKPHPDPVFAAVCKACLYLWRRAERGEIDADDNIEICY